MYDERYKNKLIEQSENFNQQEIMYYIYAEVEKNALHVTPFVLNENNKKLFFVFPDYLKKKEEYRIFTKNFEAIGLTLKGSTIIYYGIDEKKFKEVILTYSMKKKKTCIS